MTSGVRNRIELPSELAEWIEVSVGAPLLRAERMQGGGRREAWLIDVAPAATSARSLFLAVDPESDQSANPFTLHREAQILRFLTDTGVPAPRVVATHPVAQAVLCERVNGSTSLTHLDHSARVEVAHSFIDAVALLHALPVDQAMLPGEPLDDDLRLQVRREIDRWSALYRSSGRADALIEFGLRYLQDNVPDVDGPIRIVHGDCGPGNFLHDGRGVTAILDWELAHFGDPMEDLAWIDVRDVFDPLPDYAGVLARYATRADFPVDTDRIRYYRAFNELRVVILASLRELDPATGEAATWLVLGPIHRRLCVDALAELCHVDVRRAPALSAPLPVTEGLYSRVVSDLRDIASRQDVPDYTSARIKATTRIVKYLQAVNRLQAVATEAERADLGVVLNDRIDDLEQSRRILAAHAAHRTLPDEDILGYLVRQTQRECQLVETAAGSLASRQFSPLPATFGSK